jgi:hypothetical protein
MNFNILQHHKWVALVGVLSISLVALSFGDDAFASPQKVTYKGAAVTTAVPGKAFPIAFQVKNIGDTNYAGVKVIFHFPGDFTISNVAPGAGVVDGSEVSWSNVPLEVGKSFYPSFTLTMDSGTPVKTKQNIWVEVTGEGMEATSQNFSITAVKATAVKKTTLSSSDVSALFQSVYGRVPTSSELKYWNGRRSDKPTSTALLGAMGYHKAQGINH